MRQTKKNSLFNSRIEIVTHYIESFPSCSCCNIDFCNFNCRYLMKHLHEITF